MRVSNTPQTKLLTSLSWERASAVSPRFPHARIFANAGWGNDRSDRCVGRAEALEIILNLKRYSRRSKVIFASPLILLGCIMVFKAQAADGGIASAVAEAGCVQSSIKTLPPIGKALVYEATCAGTSHTIVRVVCMNGKCTPDHPHGRRDEPGERDE